MAEKLTMRDALELVRDCSSLEWQQPDGKRMGATDNQGRRMWFITEDVMRAVRKALGVTTEHTDHPLRHYDRTCPACNAGVASDGGKV